MQNSSNHTVPNGFTLVPLGAQQFYQMAQQHAVVNAPLAHMMPAYLPLSESDAYSSVMALGAYNMPHHMIQPSTPMEGPGMFDAQVWHSNAFGYMPQSSVPACEPSPSYLLPSLDSLHARAAPSAALHAMSPLPSPLPPASSGARAERVGPFPSDSDAEHISDAPFADEHKWRKYGQKQVKRSPYPRNYYKCTVAGCPAKKHLEKFWDANANRERCRTVYLGEHVHPVATSPQVFATSQQDFQTNVLAQSAKLRAVNVSLVAVLDADELANQQRLVVECSSQVDENEDGFYWRKYGQKAVKGSSTPRQYYRCRATNCCVKKTVEASPKGNTIVTYDGCHNHEHSFLTPVSPAVAVDAHSPVSPASYASRSASPSLPTQQQQQQAREQNLISFASSTPAVHFAMSHAHSHSQTPTPMTQYLPALDPYQAPVTTATTRFPVKLETLPQAYPVVESPSSSFSTTDDEDYLSEPSSKRSTKDEDIDLDVYHQFAPDAPPAESWYYPTWEPSTELLSQ